MARHPDYNSSAELKAYMDAMSIAMRKQYGQNFLIKQDVRERIIDAALKGTQTSLSPDGCHSMDAVDANVWEVGPGLGAMTEELLRRGAIVTAFEIDKAFVSSLTAFFREYIAKDKLHIIEGDVLKTWEKEADRLYASNDVPKDLTLFGNLPYNIAATLMASIIEKSAAKWGRVPFARCVITVQKEVAQRMAAAAGSDDYSSLSVVMQWAYEVKPLLDIGPSSFWPRPRVASRTLLLTRRPAFPRCRDPRVFVKMTRALFSSRRKTIRNNLSTFMSDTVAAEEVLKNAGIDKETRAETLNIDTLLYLSDVIADSNYRNKKDYYSLNDRGSERDKG